MTAYFRDHPDKYIGIHCSYGFNRTGFVVCSYLVEELGYTIDEALQAFSDSRPPGKDEGQSKLREGGLPIYLSIYLSIHPPTHSLAPSSPSSCQE